MRNKSAKTSKIKVFGNILHKNVEMYGSGIDYRVASLIKGTLLLKEKSLKV